MSDRPIMQHTPGPWTFGVRSDGSMWLSIGDRERGPHHQGDLCATEADARLIVASPRLLTAAVVLREAQRDYMADRGNNEKGRAVEFAAEDLDAAINAATDPTPMTTDRNSEGAVAWQRRITPDNGKPLAWEYFAGAVDYDNDPAKFPATVGRWSAEYRPLFLAPPAAEVQALVERWRGLADRSLRSSGTWSGDQLADRIESMADELAKLIPRGK